MATYEQLIDADLAALGFNQAAQSGALGNFEVESDFNPGAYNPNENAHGIAQWEGGRYSNGLLAYAQSHHLDPNSIQADLGYLNQELQGPYSNVLAAGRATPNTAAGASSFAQIWQSLFEGSTVASLPQRQSNALAIFNNGHLTLTASTTAAPAPTTPPTSATLASSLFPYLPGMPLIPGFNIPGPNLPGVAGQVGQGIASGVGSVLSGITHPIVQFLEDSALVVFGLVFLLVGLAVLAIHHGDINLMPSTDDDDDVGQSAALAESSKAGAGVDDAALAA